MLIDGGLKFTMHNHDSFSRRFLMTGKPNLLVAFPLPPAAAKYFYHVYMNR